MRKCFDTSNRWHRISLAALVVIFFVAGIPAVGKKIQKPAPKAVQSNAKSENRVHDINGDLSVVVPTGWRHLSREYLGAKLILAGPRLGGFTTNICLATEAVGSMSLSEYQGQSEINGPKLLSGYKNISSSPRSLGGTPGTQWMYTAEMGTPAKTLKFKSIYAVRNGTAFVLTLTCPVSRFEKDVPAFESVVKSLKWLDKKGGAAKQPTGQAK